MAAAPPQPTTAPASLLADDGAVLPLAGDSGGEKGDPADLSATITRRLQEGSCDCVICTEPIAASQPLWWCRRCFAVQHLPCMQYWASSRGGATGMPRCPLCQHEQGANTLEFRCFCGKVAQPVVSPNCPVPGTCGLPCGKRQADPRCPHICTQLCHPGPCPPCGHVREQSCYCGADVASVGCSSGVSGFGCGTACGKELNCGRHYCERACHPGACAMCQVVGPTVCYCQRSSKLQQCDTDLSWSCGSLCAKLLDCGVHQCTRTCHVGGCGLCGRTLERQRTCPCGKRAIVELFAAGAPPRVRCDDPIPTCGQTCGLPRSSCAHCCTAACHDSDCPPCVATVTISCRCGRQRFDVPCFSTTIRLPRAASAATPPPDPPGGRESPEPDRTVWLETAQRLGIKPKSLPNNFPPRCPRRCQEKLSCGRHACETTCCDNPDHTCFRVCRKRAPCGAHECGRLCHKGPCPPCSFTSYEPLYCKCGKTVLEPPVPCSTPPPRCSHPCSIARRCGHPANHACHPDGDCPPCVLPVAKLCASHGLPFDWFQPCHTEAPSCSKPCSKVLPCKHGICTKPCHVGACPCQTCAKNHAAAGPAASGKGARR